MTSVKDFGAFVEILPGKDGLCHISELSDEYVNSVADVCKVGDEMQVKVIAIDEQDRVKLSRKQAMRELAEKEKAEARRSDRLRLEVRRTHCVRPIDRSSSPGGALTPPGVAIGKLSSQLQPAAE